MEKEERIKLKMKRSDLWFFGVTISVMLGVFAYILIPNLIMWDYFKFWWVLLLPYIVIKIFFMNSRLFKWLNADVTVFTIRESTVREYENKKL